MKIYHLILISIIVINFLYSQQNVKDIENMVLDEIYINNKKEKKDDSEKMNDFTDMSSLSAKAIINKNDIPWKQIFENVKQKSYINQNQIMNLYAIKNDRYLKNNNFKFPKQTMKIIGFLIEGEGHITINNKRSKINSGSAFFVPSKGNVVFSIQSNSAYILNVLDIKKEDEDNKLNKVLEKKLSENEIKKFIFTWFDNFDKRADISYFTNILIGKIYKKTYLEPLIKDKKGFEKWYQKTVRSRIKSNNFSINDIELIPQQSGNIQVQFEVKWEANFNKGVVITGVYEENWELTLDEDNQIKIMNYHVEQTQ